MQKEIFTRAEVKVLLEQVIKQVRNRKPQKSNTHGNGKHDAITTDSDTGCSTPG